VPIADIGFQNDTDCDMHLLRGQVLPPLRRAGTIFVDVVGGARVWLSDYTATDLKVEFRPTFRYSNNGTEYYGFGIRVNHQTGAVTTDPPPVGADRIDNFLIEVVVVRNDGGSAPSTFEPMTVRVHLHQSVQAFWVTPTRMTVRRRTPATTAAPEQTHFRFTARAEFDDGTVGDVTLHHGVRWSPAASFAPQPNPPNSQQAAAFGRILLPTGLGPATGTSVTATLPAALGGASATATFTVRPPWSEPGEAPQVELFSPASAPGTVLPEHLPNVLFIPSGYLATDLPDFETHTVNLLHRMRLDPLSKPFDHLSLAMNFWRVAVPSPERGTCVRTEVVVTNGAPQQARVLPSLARPTPGLPIEIQHLMYLSGLAMPTDVKVDLKTLRERWAKTWPNAFGLAPDDPWPTGRLLDPLNTEDLKDEEIDRWRSCGHRTFVDEVDSALPTAVGVPTLVDNSAITLHPDRGGAQVFNDFLAALVDKNGMTLGVPAPGTQIGLLWAQDQSRHRFNNAGLVTMLCATELGRKNARNRVMLSLNGLSWGHVVPIAGRNAVRELHPMVAGLPNNLERVFIHELAHRFGLADEYVDDAKAFPYAEPVLDPWANVTSLVAVRQADHFRADLIKWNWERVRWAGVLASDLATSGSDFIATLLPEHARGFKKDQDVRLRLRSTTVPLMRIDDLGPVFKIEGIAGNTVTLRQKLAGPSPFNPTTVVTGSVLYAPVPAPAEAGPTVPYARMIAPVIATQIDNGNKPLTRWPRSVRELYEEAQIGDGLQLPTTITFGGFLTTWSYRLDARIVGLYEGGAHFAKDVFHPAGACKLRDSRNEFWPFCPVCRYVLVEFIDPSGHAAMDVEYARQYPLKP